MVLGGTASTTGLETKTVETPATVMAGASATMKFDFGSTDGGTDAPVDDADAGVIDGPVDLTPMLTWTRTKPTSAMDAATRDVPAEMPGTDVAADRAPADVAVDMPSPIDTSGDVPPIGTNCTLKGQYAASIGIGGFGADGRLRGPTVRRRVEGGDGPPLQRGVGGRHSPAQHRQDGRLRDGAGREHPASRPRRDRFRPRLRAV